MRGRNCHWFGEMFMRARDGKKVNSWLFEIADVLVRLDHVASFIVNARITVSQPSIPIIKRNHALYIAA
jgi:hypothetical protein